MPTLDPDFLKTLDRRAAQQREFERTLEAMTPAQHEEYQQVVAERQRQERQRREGVARHVAEREGQRKAHFRDRGL